MFTEDLHIASALINKDEEVTKRFFFQQCRPLFISIISYVFDYEVDYDEFVNELYLHIMENDAYRLRQFRGDSTIFQWMKTVAIRFFIDKRARLIDSTSQEPLIIPERGSTNEAERCEAKMDVDSLLSKMTNKRYRLVIEMLILKSMTPETVAQQLHVKIDNLYNIKKRALNQLTSIALNQTKKNEGH